jgi:hypothetical protein
MPSNKYLQHLVLSVAIGGHVVEKQASSFTLVTDAGLPLVMAKLIYPHTAEIGIRGEEVIVSLIAGDEPVVYFTGTIYKIYEEGNLRVLELTDGYKKLCDTKITPAYRKEQAKMILQDTLDAAGITDTAITCLRVEVGWFSMVSINALEEHGIRGLRYFFDEQDRFHFGKKDDTGKHEGTETVFENGKDIITKGEGYIEVMPYPIRHSQSITVDGVAMQTIRTELVRLV